MGYLRRNLYNPNLIEIPEYDKINYSFVIDEEREFINNYIRNKEKNSFLSLKDMTEEDVSVLVKLSRFYRDNPSLGLTYDELERIFVESIFDQNRKMGMRLYYKLKYFKDYDLYILFSRFFDENEKDLVRYIVSMKKDFKEYTEKDANQIVYINGERFVNREISINDNPVDYYLNKMFITHEDLMKEHKKMLSLKNVDEKK